MGDTLTIALPSSRVKLAYQGETVDADEVQFTVRSEASGSYAIESDGAEIELRHEVKNIYRLVDKKKEDGSPIYIVTGAAALTTSVPSNEA